MNVLVFTLLIWICSLAAGLLGALTGLGGGVVIVPLLVLAFKVNIHYAAGASLISIIATSSGSAAAYVKEGYSNVRIGMFLEVATTIGALLGAYLVAKVSPSAIAVIFGLVLLFSAGLSLRKTPAITGTRPPDPLATRLRLNGDYPTAEGLKKYTVRRVPVGFLVCNCAGILSGLLGIGSGALKVVGMDQAMEIPFKVSTATSNFMIGVTAAASAGIYFHRGYVAPALAMPVMLGVLTGAFIGARILPGATTKYLRVLFSAAIVILGIEMLVKGLGGRL
ncbi:MAG TPA: sulfite exporter TauE/SafE family protein [Candidatus Acidoferrales bacterium]|nr:sulfite exporter TauE/SafE family protein [Candidatus Acidoferrales bacterium]